MEGSQRGSGREEETGDPLFTSSIVSIRRFDFTLLVSFCLTGVVVAISRLSTVF